MNETVSKFLLAGDTFMHEMHLTEPRFTSNACETLTKNKERKGRKGDSKYIYQNELDKAYFQHDMAYGDFKDSPGRAASYKILRDKVFNITKNPKCYGY